MFQCEDQQALQTLIETHTITLENQKTPWQILDAVAMAIKSEEHFWHFQDKLLLDVTQLLDEGIHALSTRMTSLVNNCKFPNKETKETMKIMLLQHVVSITNPVTGSRNKTSSSSPTRPSFPLPTARVLM